ALHVEADRIIVKHRPDSERCKPNVPKRDEQYITNGSIDGISVGIAESRLGSRHRPTSLEIAKDSKAGGGCCEMLECMGRYRCTEKHAGRNHRHAQPGSQRGPRRTDDQGTFCPAWRRSASVVAQRVRQAHRGRNRKVGQTNQVLRCEAGLIWAFPAQLSALSVPPSLQRMFVHEHSGRSLPASRSVVRETIPPDCPGAISLSAWRPAHPLRGAAALLRPPELRVPR